MADQIDLYFYTDDGKIAGSISAETPENATAALAWFKANTDFVPNGPDGAEAPVEAEKPKRGRKSKKSASDDKVEESPSDDTPAAEPEPAKATKAEVEDALRALCSADGSDAGTKAMIDMLVKLGATNEAGAPKLSLLPEGKFAEAIEAAKRLTAEIQAKAAATADVLG